MNHGFYQRELLFILELCMRKNIKMIIGAVFGALLMPIISIIGAGSPRTPSSARPAATGIATTPTRRTPVPITSAGRTCQLYIENGEVKAKGFANKPSGEMLIMFARDHLTEVADLEIVVARLEQKNYVRWPAEFIDNRYAVIREQLQDLKNRIAQLKSPASPDLSAVALADVPTTPNQPAGGGVGLLPGAPGVHDTPSGDAHSGHDGALADEDTTDGEGEDGDASGGDQVLTGPGQPEVVGTDLPLVSPHRTSDGPGNVALSGSEGLTLAIQSPAHHKPQGVVVSQSTFVKTVGLSLLVTAIAVGIDGMVRKERSFLLRFWRWITGKKKASLPTEQEIRAMAQKLVEEGI